MDVGISDDVLNGSVPYEISSDEDKSDSDADGDEDGKLKFSIINNLTIN